MPYLSRKLLLLAVVLAVSTSSGCGYLQARGNDALDILDVGITVSKNPHVAIYTGFNSILTAGYSDMDGHLLGLGHQRFGALHMRYKAAGALLEGYEQVGYEDYTENDSNSPRTRGLGLGLLYRDRPNSVSQALQCQKFVHLGWIGVNLNCKVGAILKFVVGLTTIDIGKPSGDGAPYVPAPVTTSLGKPASSPGICPT